MSSIHFKPVQQLLNFSMCLTNFYQANFFPVNQGFLKPKIDILKI